MQTYSTKAAAKKGAIRKGMDLSNIAFLQNGEGRWYWDEHQVGGFNFCPHCDVHVSNGVLDLEDYFDDVKEGHIDHNESSVDAALAKIVKETTNQYECLGCGGQFGPALKLELPTKGTGIKIEKDREERNGITRPSEGGKCRAVWDACDVLYKESGEVPKPASIKQWAEENGFNLTNAVLEMYQWRRFNGFIGRQK